MQKLWVLLLLAAGFAGGYSYRNVGEPYKLDYRRAVVNLPITFTKHLNNDKYALGEKYLAEDLAAELKNRALTRGSIRLRTLFQTGILTKGLKSI